MSGQGAPSIEVDGRGLTVEIVAASWHADIVDGLVAGAVEACEAAGAAYRVVRVPGCFELPVVVETIARVTSRGTRTGDVNHPIVALGVVIKGETPHFEYVAGATTQGLGDVARIHAVPVGFGVLTCDTVEQALDRAGLPGSRESKGREAVEAAISIARVIQELRA